MNNAENTNADTIKNPLKLILIVILVTVISILHYSTIHAQLGHHIPHKGLYFIPIILASFWFGRKIGLFTSISVSILYAAHILVIQGLHNNLLAVTFQLLELNVVAFILGWLVDRRNRQIEENIVTENLAVLGRASTAVGCEMKDLLATLNRIANKAKGLNYTELDQDFTKEMARLEQMVNVLSSFSTTDQVQFFSHDLNEIIRGKINKYKKAANRIGINFETNLDESTCPSRVNISQIEWVVEQILKNALEVSSKGNTIHFRSHRSGDTCTIEVEDEGPGIRMENLKNIFRPFFTTKKEGYGLALAACRKVLQDMGGDVNVKSASGKGALFTIIVPREYSGKPLSMDPIETVVQGEKVEGLYRE